MFDIFKKNICSILTMLMLVACGDKGGDEPPKPQGEYTIIFDTRGADTVASQKVKVGEKVKEPKPDPTYEDYVFSGWNENPKGSSGKFNFDTPIKKDIKLYAQWNTFKFSKKDLRVEEKGDTDGGSNIEQITVYRNSTLNSGNFGIQWNIVDGSGVFGQAFGTTPIKNSGDSVDINVLVEWDNKPEIDREFIIKGTATSEETGQTFDFKDLILKEGGDDPYGVFDIESGFEEMTVVVGNDLTPVPQNSVRIRRNRGNFGRVKVSHEVVTNVEAAARISGMDQSKIAISGTHYRVNNNNSYVVFPVSENFKFTTTPPISIIGSNFSKDERKIIVWRLSSVKLVNGKDEDIRSTVANSPRIDNQSPHKIINLVKN